MKFILLVEGQTEGESIAKFIKRWLDPKTKSPVGIQVSSYDGFADLERKLVTKARMHLDGPKNSEIVAVVGLLDLYGPNFYPENVSSNDGKIDWATKHFQDQVSRKLFRMFFAVHEYEAWLLSQPSIFPREVANILPKSIERPESVNSTEPPGKLLNRLWNQALMKNYKKRVYGKQLFDKLDPKIAASKCPRMAEMLDEMLQVLRDAGLVDSQQ